jgi:cytochrome c nitrite reductase small subunit
MALAESSQLRQRHPDEKLLGLMNMSNRLIPDSVTAPGKDGLLLRALLVAAVGALAGAGIHTFRYAKGMSYFSSDPKACMNCHIMRPQFDSWQKSSHHTVATCVDCHLPHSFIPKYLAKASNGWHHSKGFSLQDFHEPIQIKPDNSAILEKNCISCHSALVHQVNPPASPHARTAVGCVHCHVSVGHGERAGLGGPFRLEEVQLPESPSPSARKEK